MFKLIRYHLPPLVKHVVSQSNEFGMKLRCVFKKLKSCFPKPSIVAYRRTKSLKDLLVRAKLCTVRKSSRAKNDYKPCQGGCQLCWISEKASSHKDTRTGQQWNIADTNSRLWIRRTAGYGRNFKLQINKFCSSFSSNVAT